MAHGRKKELLKELPVQCALTEAGTQPVSRD